MPPPKAFLLEERHSARQRSFKKPLQGEGQDERGGMQQRPPTMGGGYKLSSLGGSQEGERMKTRRLQRLLRATNKTTAQTGSLCVHTAVTTQLRPGKVNKSPGYKEKVVFGPSP